MPKNKKQSPILFTVYRRRQLTLHKVRDLKAWLNTYKKKFKTNMVALLDMVSELIDSGVSKIQDGELCVINGPATYWAYRDFVKSIKEPDKVIPWHKPPREIEPAVD
jgi:hypothetical protein